MSNVSSGMNYAPKGKAKPVVKPGEFVFSAVRLDHGHIYGMCNGLTEAGGTLKYVYDKDPRKVEAFLKAFPQAKPARSEEEALEDRETYMIAGAAVTSQRCELGLKALAAGKDYFTDKAPFTTLDQLASAKEMVKKTNRRYMVYYSERLHVEGAVLAGYMVEQGLIGKVVNVAGFGPHRLMADRRPDWFFIKENYGGILCDIGSHQIEQYLYFAGEEDGKVISSRIANYGNPEHPQLDDFGDCAITGKNGTTNYFRVDWFTPDGLRTWGDGRTLILGTKGYIEIRKYIDVARENEGGNHVYLVNGDGEKYVNATGVTGCPFFGQLILDSLNRTENAMTQAHAFKAAELCLQAQAQAVDLTPDLSGRK
ncbi:MAG: Gfo/Idh/MocA family oxidoreductase [Clostridia bacterium]|nr:Gfo/Idh/MocA family oxidoreductase [Clostridia bacterium]